MKSACPFKVEMPGEDLLAPYVPAAAKCVNDGMLSAVPDSRCWREVC